MGQHLQKLQDILTHAEMWLPGGLRMGRLGNDVGCCRQVFEEISNKTHAKLLTTWFQVPSPNDVPKDITWKLEANITHRIPIVTYIIPIIPVLSISFSYS